MFGVETNFFRGTLKGELEQRRNKEHQDNPKNFPSFGIQEFKASRKTGEGKYQRICALQPYHERGAIKFQGKNLETLQGTQSELAYQMLQFPNSAHDVILDSLAYHLDLIRKGGLVKKKKAPWSSPAWFEREQQKKELGYNRLRPRRARQWVAPLAFS